MMKKCFEILMNEKPNYWLTYTLFFLSFIGCIGILVSIYMLVEYGGFTKKEYFIENLGYLGSYFSGFTSFFIFILTTIAVYFSYQAYKKEIERVRQQRFEDHFFHLLEIHRENVKMIEIEHKSFDFRKFEKGAYTSVKAILKMFRELMVMIDVVDFEKNSVRKASLVYLCFYYGFGGRSGKILMEQLSKSAVNKNEIEQLKCFFSDLPEHRRKITMFKEEYQVLGNKAILRKTILDSKINKLYESMPRKELSDKAEIKYKAAGGHQTRLDHYFANLLFCFDLIAEQNKHMVISDLEIYRKELISQLNVYEKILLIFHSNTIVGKDFKKYVLEYDLKKNIPEGMLKKEEFDIHQYFMELNENELLKK